MTIEIVSRAGRRVAVVADTDSRCRWGVQLAASLGPDRPIDCYQPAFCEPPSPRQLAEVGVLPERLQVVTAAELVASLAETTPLLRAVVRRGARSVYRHGVDVVAPTLRKLAAR